MNKMHLNRRGACAALLAGSAALITRMPLALAHRAKESLTTIEWNERTSSLEVIHRLHAQDAQTAVTDVMGVHPPDLTDLKPRAALALYVERRFSLGLGGEPEALKTLGAELDGNYVFVYQEAKLAVLPQALAITNTILLDLFGTQTNTVNMRIGGPVHTAVFSGSHTQEVISLTAQ